MRMHGEPVPAASPRLEAADMPIDSANVATSGAGRAIVPAADLPR